MHLYEYIVVRYNAWICVFCSYFLYLVLQYIALAVGTDCESGSECPGMEALLEAGTAQLMPKLLSDGNVDQVEDDKRMITHIGNAQDYHNMK